MARERRAAVFFINFVFRLSSADYAGLYASPQRFALLLILVTELVVVGITQDPNVSAKTEKDMTNSIAQNADTYLKQVLAFILLIVMPLLLLKFRHGYIQ